MPQKNQHIMIFRELQTSIFCEIEMSLKHFNQFLKLGKEEEHAGIGEAIDGFDQTGENSSPTTSTDTATAVDSNTALKNFLNSIHISSIPNIQNKNFHVVQLKIDDIMKDAIKVMLDKNVYCAPIVDGISSTSLDKKATNRYIGLLTFSNMVLWCLEVMEKNGCFDVENNGFFSLLEQNPCVGQTKIRELAKSFLWDPFFPVNLEGDTLIRALLLYSKHPIHVLPVTDKSNTEITGFITQNALLELLLQSSGLEWFDNIGNRPLSDFRFNNDEHCPNVYSDQSVWDTIRIMWKYKASVVAVVERGSEELVGSFRSFDIHLLVENDELFKRIRNTSMAEFMQLDSVFKHDKHTGPAILGRNPTGSKTGRDVFLRNKCQATGFHVTITMAHTMEQAMQTMVENRTDTCFIIDSGSNQMMRAITSRNIITEFAPPGVDTKYHGGGFFETALDQTGCHLEKGTLFCGH